MRFNTAAIQAKMGNQGVVTLGENMEFITVEDSPGDLAAITAYPCSPGANFFLVNNSGFTLRVFPSAGDKMPGELVDNPIILQPISDRIIMFIASTSKKWALSDVQWG